MKLVSIIPAFNEEETIARVVHHVPKSITGIDAIEVLVINDGSTDTTAARAKEAGATVYTHTPNRGLSYTFNRGVELALAHGADIIANMDADMQHDPNDIPQLVAPLLRGEAEIAIGVRKIDADKSMYWGNRYGNKMGNWVMGKLTGQKLLDASSGFRTFTREVALNLHLRSNHTYTHEMLIQALFKGFSLAQVPITSQRRTAGKSKLIKTLPSHIRESLKIILRTVVTYKPFKTFLVTGVGICLFGMLLGARYLWLVVHQSPGHIPSLLLSAVLLLIGFITVVLGVLADLLATNRKIEEEMLYQLKKQGTYRTIPSPYEN